MTTLKKLLFQHRKFLVGLFFFSLLLRALLFISFTQHNKNAWIYFDSDQYLTLANQITSGKGISVPSGEAQFYRLPGYSIFLAACFNLFGPSIKYALWLQIFISSFIPLLIFFLSLCLLPQALLLAKISSLLAAVHLGFVLYSGMIATEPLCILFLLLFFILFFNALKKNLPTFAFFISGVFLGLASMIRPIGHYLILVALMLIFIFQKQETNKIKSCTAISIGWLLIVGPWLIRNLLLTGYIFFHTLSGLHFLQYTAANIVIHQDNIGYVQARSRLLGEWKEKIKNKEKLINKKLNEYKRCQIGERSALSYIIKHPIYALHYSTIQIFKTCLGQYSAQIILSDTGLWPDYNKNSSWLMKVKRFLLPQPKHKLLILIIYFELIFSFFFLLGILCFLFLMWQNKNMLSIFLKAGSFAALLIFITVAYGCARLRLPAEPLLIIFSTAGWLEVFHKWKAKNV